MSNKIDDSLRNFGDVVRTIHTDLYTLKAKSILDALIYTLAYKWGSKQMKRNACLSNTIVEPNGEISWKIHISAYGNKAYYTFYYCNSSLYKLNNDDKLREWIALNMKLAVRKNLSYNGMSAEDHWKRNDTTILTWFSDDTNKITVADVYCIYDQLLNRKRISKHWPKEMLKSIVGQEKDPAATELELARREELQKLEIKFKADCSDLKKQQGEEKYKIVTEIDAKYQKLIEEKTKEYEQAKIDLNNSLSFINEAQLPSFLS